MNIEKITTILTNLKADVEKNNGKEKPDPIVFRRTEDDTGIKTFQDLKDWWKEQPVCIRQNKIIEDYMTTLLVDLNDNNKKTRYLDTDYLVANKDKFIEVLTYLQQNPVGKYGGSGKPKKKSNKKKSNKKKAGSKKKSNKKSLQKKR